MLKNTLNEISLEDTKMFAGNPRRSAPYNKIAKNNVKNLYQLFDSFDRGTLDLGKSSDLSYDNDSVVETIGIIKLLKYKYLGVPLDIDFNFNITSLLDYSKRWGEDRREFVKYLQSIGLPFSISIKIYFYLHNKKIDSYTVLDVLNGIASGLFGFTSNEPKSFTIALYEKASILLDCFNKKEYEKHFMIRNENQWFEMMDPRELKEYRRSKYFEVKDAFENINFEEYNDAYFLEDDEDFYKYIELKGKIKARTK